MPSTGTFKTLFPHSRLITWLLCIIFSTRRESATLPDTYIKPTSKARQVSPYLLCNFSIYLAFVLTSLTPVQTAGPPLRGSILLRFLFLRTSVSPPLLDVRAAVSAHLGARRKQTLERRGSGVGAGGATTPDKAGIIAKVKACLGGSQVTCKLIWHAGLGF